MDYSFRVHIAQWGDKPGQGREVRRGVMAGRCRGVPLVLLLALAGQLAPSPVLAGGRPYESKIGGFMYAAMEALITGEFAGRRPSQVDASLTRPVCRGSDYDDLRAAAHDRVAFDELRRRCQWVETINDSTHVHATAYLPPGYCGILKSAFDAMLLDHIYGPPRHPNREEVMFEYKGSHYSATVRTLASGARIESSCEADGALRVSAPRKRR